MHDAGGLRALPAARIIGFVADAAERWCDADFAPRVRAAAAIEARLSYTAPVVDYALDRLFREVTRDALGGGDRLGAGQRRSARRHRRRGAARRRHGRAASTAPSIVSSDTTIGVAVVPALFALCAKCDVVVKDRSDALVTGFFASLAEEHPAFGRAALARAWQGGDDPDEDALLARADTVVAFGRDETLRAIRARCGAGARFVPFGHRASIGRLTRDEAAALDGAQAERIARDALLYDGEGCLSLHALFVHARGDALARVAALLAAACERVAVEFPSGPRSPQRSAQVAAYRNLAAFRAASGRGEVFRTADATLVADPPHEEPPPFLPRVLPLIAVEDDAAVAGYAAAQQLPVQALGVLAADARAVALAERIGAVRVAPFGTLQAPPLGGHHGGAPRIADFVRWIDRE